MRTLAISIVAAAVASLPANADELHRQNPINSFGGLSAQDARNPSGLGWFSEVIDNFNAQAGTIVTAIEFWGGYVTDIPGNTRGFMIRFYDGSELFPGPLISTQDATLFSETEYYSTLIPGLGTVRGYRYQITLPDPVTLPATGTVWMSVTAILDRGGGSNEPQWGWVDAATTNLPVCNQWFFAPGNFQPQGRDVAFVIHGTPPAAPCDPDLNQDGNVDQSDVAYLVQIVAGGENPLGADPDFNRDGNADQSDIALLVAVVAGEPCP